MMSSRRKKLLLCCLLSVTGILPAAGFLWWSLAPRYAEDPMVKLRKQTPVRIYLDKDGNEVYLERTYDFQWRFELPLKEIPPKLIRIILAAEDADFYEHSGVDYKAVCRAFFQNLIHGRIVSGASTVTMQLAGMADPDRSRTFGRKLRQAAGARKLEALYTKEEILEAYLNRIPFGGKIYGLEAAARFYFGMHMKDLSVAETALLCGLPQRPNAYRPDRHYDRARKRQKRVLAMLERRGVIGKGMAERLFMETPRLRDTSVPSDFESKADPGIHRFYFRHAGKEAGNAYLVKTAYRPGIQKLVTEILRSHTSGRPQAQDAAAVLLDNKNGEVLALAGTLDWYAPAGQVNAAMSVRTAGSVLKPFLYREAIRAGFVTEDTVLQDTPLRYGSYMPGNADGVFHGDVTMKDSLIKSLNTTAIRLLASLGTLRTAEMLESLKLLENPEAKAEETGLSLALGTAGHTPFAIAQAYTSFTGDMLDATFLSGREDMVRTPESASAMIQDILSATPLPGFTGNAAWKTGTSSGSRDAWCAAFTPDYTLCVWMGSKDGSGIPGMTGAKAAAPCAGAILQALYEGRRTPELINTADSRYFVFSKLCRKTGLTADVSCAETYSGVTAKGIPLRKCRKCRLPDTKENPLRILSPRPGEYLAGPDGTVKFRLQVSEGNVFWYTEKNYIGQLSPEERISFAPGFHRVTAVSADDPDRSVCVEFSVTE